MRAERYEWYVTCTIRSQGPETKGTKLLENHQDAEGDVDVPVVVPAAVHVRQAAVLGAARDKPVPGTASVFAPFPGVGGTQIRQVLIHLLTEPIEEVADQVPFFH